MHSFFFELVEKKKLIQNFCTPLHFSNIFPRVAFLPNISKSIVCTNKFRKHSDLTSICIVPTPWGQIRWDSSPTLQSRFKFDLVKILETIDFEISRRKVILGKMLEKWETKPCKWKCKRLPYQRPNNNSSLLNFKILLFNTTELCDY